MTQPARIGRRRTFMRSPLWRGIAAVSLSAATVSAAEAQVAGSFEQLQSLVEPRDRVTVTDRTGQELTGSITSLSPASLTLLVEGSQRVFDELVFDEPDVSEIRQRRPDSLMDGAVYGLGIGLGWGWLTLVEAGGSDSANIVLANTSILGAVLGVVIDAIIQRRRVIYRLSGSARRLTVSPLVARGRRGVAVSLGF